MIFEIASSLLVGAGLGYMKLKTGKSDADKIEKIAKNCGLVIKDGDTKSIQLLRRTRFEGGTEYAYRIPLGLSFSDFQKKLEHIQDGLNNKKTLIDVSWNDVKEINLKGDIKQQLQGIIHREQIRKEVEMEYDGLLKIKVYDKGLADLFPYTQALLDQVKGWQIPIGITKQKLLTHNFDTSPHMIVAGTTRYGKTVFLKNLITTLTHNQAKNVKFTLIDLKGGLAFNRFKNTSQVKCMAKDTQEAFVALEKIHNEMKLRMDTFLRKGYEDITEAGIKERHFIVIDEAFELSSVKETNTELKAMKKRCEYLISEIARIGGGIGYRLIFCTQYPTAETLPNQVKANATAKVCFLLDTEIQSRVVLDESGAERLPFIKGRAIYRTDRKHVVQAPFITNEFIQEVIEPHIIRKEKHHEVPVRKNEERRRDIVEFEKA